jgi:hypothetical protein
MWLELDGHRFQNGSTATMVFGVAQLVSYLSRFMSLQPGDIISTGTPPGVGMGQKPPVFLRAGQTMRLGVEGLGVQTQAVVAALVEHQPRVLAHGVEPDLRPVGLDRSQLGRVLQQQRRRVDRVQATRCALASMKRLSSAPWRRRPQVTQRATW